MEANKIMNADILDIIFEGKNKSYGAYELRKTYNSRILKAMLATGVLILLVGVGLLLASIKVNKVTTLDTQETQMADVKKDETPPPPPPPTPTPPPPPEIKQIQFTPPIVKKDEEVKKDEKIQEIKEEAAISTKTVETDNTKQKIEVAPEETKQSEVVAEKPKPVEEDKVFTKVEIEAEYPGGQGAWGKYLQNNLNANVPVENSAPPGSYTVIVRFIVAKDGTISEVTPETSLGYGMEQEAVKIIRKGPKWTPAQQNGNVVKAYRRQPIKFVVAEE